MYVIITRNQCNFCDDAKALLKGQGISFVEYNIQSDSSKWILHLLKSSNITTVPQVFNDKGTYIGGYTDLKEYLL